MVRYIRYGLYFLKHCLASYSYHKPYQQNSWLSYRHPAMMAKQLLVHWPIHIRTWLCVSPTCQEKFYNIWVISRVLIGWELWSIRAQTMEITWWWCNICFSLPFAHNFPRTSNRKWTSKIIKKGQHRNDANV